MICGAEGSSSRDFVCSECGDPLAVTMYCLRCGRRLALDEDNAMGFLAEHGFDVDDPRGLVIKVSCCSACMSDDDVADVAVYRIRFGT